MKKEKPKSSKTAFVVVNEAGEEQRVFTVSQHGKEAQSLAEDFAGKFGFRVQ